jgi:hypothetical protein
MSRYLVIIRDIKEFPYEVEAADEMKAREEAEAMWEFDGGPQADYYELSARRLEDKP